MSDFAQEVTSQIPATNAEGKIEVKFPDGGRGFINPGEEAQAQQEGIQILSADDVQHEKDLEAADDDNLLAGAVSTLSGATLGLSDHVVKKFIGEKKLRDLYEANPNITTAGEVAGTIAPAFITGGAALPAGIAESAGKRAISLTGKALSKTTSNIVKKAITSGVGSAVEGSLYGLGQVIHEDALGDHEFNAENAFASMGKGALTGGLFGGTLGVGTEIGKSGIKAAGENVFKGLKEAIDHNYGVIKDLGATKGQIEKLNNKSGLSAKGLNDYASKLGRGGNLSVEEIVKHGDIPEHLAGGRSLKDAAFSTLDDVSENNRIVSDAGNQMIDDAISGAEAKYQQKLDSLSLKEDELVYGSDFSKKLKEELSDTSMIDDPNRGAIQGVIDDLDKIGTLVDPLTGEVTRLPMTLDNMRKQQKIWAKEADFGKFPPTRTQSVYRELWKDMGEKIDTAINSLEGAHSVKRLKQGKKLVEQSIELEKILKKGDSKNVNNKGFSLTQGLATVAGGSIGGLPGAAVGYGLRKVQQDYQDKVASFYLRKLEKYSNKGKIDISDAVDSFFKKAAKAGSIGNRASIKFLVGDQIKEDKEKDIKEIVSTYSQDPRLIVDNFVRNNSQLLETAPKTGQALQQTMLKAAQFLGSKVPKQDDSPFQDTPISRTEAQRFKNYVEAVENPYKVIDNIKHGYITPEGAEAFKVVYPKMFAAIQQEVSTRLPEFKKISEQQKAEISKRLGLDAKKAYSPQGFMKLQQLAAGSIQQEVQRQGGGGKPMDVSGRAQTGLEKVLGR